MNDTGANARLDRDGQPAFAAEALRAELAELGPAVRRFLFGLCGDWHRSEDLAQDALLRAWRGRDGFDGRASLRTWLFSIARNGWISQLRRQARRPDEETMAAAEQLGAPATSPGPPAAAERAELADAVRQALVRLPPEQREVLALRESRGLTFAEAADVLGVPVPTAKSRARYALLKLAEELEPFRQELEP